MLLGRPKSQGDFIDFLQSFKTSIQRVFSPQMSDPTAQFIVFSQTRHYEKYTQGRNIRSKGVRTRCLVITGKSERIAIPRLKIN